MEFYRCFQKHEQTISEFAYFFLSRKAIVVFNSPTRARLKSVLISPSWDRTGSGGEPRRMIHNPLERRACLEFLLVFCLPQSNNTCFPRWEHCETRSCFFCLPTCRTEAKQTPGSTKTRKHVGPRRRNRPRQHAVPSTSAPRVANS